MARGIVFFSVAVIGLLMVSYLSSYMFGPTPPLPQGVPDGVHIFSTSGETMASNGQAFIVSYNHLYTLTVELEQCASLKGLWGGSSTLKILSPISGNTTYAGETRGQSWGDKIEAVNEVPMQSFTPDAQVTFSLGEQSYHQSVDAQVEASIYYPLRAATPGFFYDAFTTNSRNVTFFVVSPEEYTKAQDHQMHEVTKENLLFNLVIAFFLGGLPLLVGGIGFWKVAHHSADRELKGTILHYGYFGNVRALDPLSGLLCDKSQSIATRRYAARALGNTGDIRAVEILIARLDDKSEDSLVRLSSAEALGKIKDVRARRSLEEAANERGHPSLQMVARSALRKLNK